MKAKDKAKKRISKYIYDTDNCIVTDLPADQDGYVSLQLCKNGRKKRFMGHRIAFELKYGKIGKGLVVCHKCDNPSCINPKHLFIGTHADNVRDRDNKGRQAKGRNNGRYKNGYYSKYAPVKKPRDPNLRGLHGRLLSPEQVNKIKEKIKNKESLILISEELGIAYHTIRDISCGRAYKNISAP